MKRHFAAVCISSRISVLLFKPALPISVYFVSLPVLRIPVEALSIPWCWGPGSHLLITPGFWGLGHGYLAQVRVNWCRNCSTRWELSRVMVHRQLCPAPRAASIHSFHPSFPVPKHSSWDSPAEDPGIFFLVAGTYETGPCIPCSPFPWSHRHLTDEKRVLVFIKLILCGF